MSQTDAEQAFDALFDEHRSAVFAYLLGRVGDRETARDLLQETFLRVWRRLGEVRALPPERRRAWVYTVARNLVTDTYRSRATRDATERAVRDSAPTRTPASEGPEARAETAERVAEVGVAVRALPEELRTILAMHAVGDQTSAQIGAALGQPPGTIRYKLAQARRRLAGTLDVTAPTTVEARP